MGETQRSREAGRGILRARPFLPGSLFLSGPSRLSHPFLNTFPIYGRGRKAVLSVKTGGCSQKWGLLLHFWYGPSGTGGGWPYVPHVRVLHICMLMYKATRVRRMHVHT